jgi:hypothetical protein
VEGGRFGGDGEGGEEGRGVMASRQQSCSLQSCERATKSSAGRWRPTHRGRPKAKCPHQPNLQHSTHSTWPTD